MKKIIIFIILAQLGTTQAVAQEYEYVPFVREGIKWVYGILNSDVIYPPVPNFPIGLHYWTLEIKGDVVINGKTYKAMHKYFGKAINEENDTVPLYLREEDKVVYGIIPDGHMYDDCPIRAFALNEYNGEEFILYDFNDQDTFWESRLNRDYEAYGGCLSTDIIQLGTLQTKRYTNLYLGNEFYCIEGVGIDQQSCGYTLCFFMPMAIGGSNLIFHLSHVIEDGQIIYKGMRYTPDNMTGLDEVVTDQRPRQYDDNYYNLMGQPVGKVLPTSHGIYIRHGKKVVIR